MSDVIVGRLMAFEKDGNDGDAVADLDVMVQVCEFKTDGTVELACNTPLRNRPRIFARPDGGNCRKAWECGLMAALNMALAEAEKELGNG